MREQQLKNIEIGFAEVIKGLESKRDLLKEEFLAKYEAEATRFDEKMGTLDVPFQLEIISERTSFSIQVKYPS